MENSFNSHNYFFTTFYSASTKPPVLIPHLLNLFSSYSLWWPLSSFLASSKFYFFYCLHVIGFWVFIFHRWMSPSKSVFHFLTNFTQYNHLKFHPFSAKCHHFIFLHRCVIFIWIYLLHSFSIHSSIEGYGVIPQFGDCKQGNGTHKYK